MLRWTAATTLVLASPAWADVPRVSVDIPPIHSLVAQVMDGIGSPDLIVQPGASPHGYSLRPSEAAALQDAALVVWVGEALTPWMEGPLEALAADAQKLELMDAEGMVLLANRDSTIFADGDHDDHHDHDHGDDHAHADEHGHDDHAHDEDHAHADKHDHDDHAHGEDHAHADAHSHDDHDHDHGEDHAHADEHGHDDHDHAHGEDHALDDHGHEGHDHGEDHADAHAHDDHGHDHDHDHDHGPIDAHIWLDPQNASAAVAAIAEALSALDPENAEGYAANAAAAQARLATLEADLTARLSGVSEPFVTFHDSTQYFEARFGITALGALALGDATDPSAASVAALRDAVQDRGTECILAEPQYNPDLINSVFGAVATIGQIDPLGAGLTPGPELYSGVLTEMTAALEGCAAAS